jgi:hypothetical protein
MAQLYISYSSRLYVLCDEHAIFYSGPLDLIWKAPYPSRKSEQCEACTALQKEA